MKPYAILDYETDPIEHRPEYPPPPKGVAIKVGSSCKYYSWGHPSDNNCTKAEATRAVKKVWRTHSLIFHNAAFDIEVGMKHMGLPWPEDFHDTLILAYLHDPRDIQLSLKPLADKYLNMPPLEQEALKDWIIENIPEAKKKKSQWGGYICRAPGAMVAPYAKGDVVRTWKLFQKFYAHIKNPVPGNPRNMLGAYRRELRLLKTKINMEQGGIRGDTKKLEKDIPGFVSCLADVDKKIYRRLKISKRWESANCKGGVFNINSGPQLAAALDEAGLVSQWILTDKGNKSTSRGNLEQCVADPKLVELLSLQGILSNYVGTFLKPWHASCVANDDYIYPSFNTTRSTNEYGSGGFGTRTGRLSSSSPNFQNVPASVEGSAHKAILKVLVKMLRQYHIDLYGLRDYLLPDEGCVFIDRDYSQQEFRILAHYEDGELLERYQADPTIDAHTLVQQMVKDATGMLYPRKSIKNVNFGIIYGMGIALLAKGIGCSYEEAKALKSIILKQVPGIEDLNDELKTMARNNNPLITYGDRFYYCEPDKYVKKEWKSFAYKQLNTLIQGSAADSTKQGMIQVEDNFTTGRLVLQVHDQNLASVPIADVKREMLAMTAGMEDMQFDLPMTSDGSWGLKGESWARLTECA